MFDSMLLWATGTPETGIDQITLQQENAKRDGLEQAYSRYLEQLQNVRTVLAHGNHRAVPDEMNRLIEMLGTKEGSISDSSAITLLYSVGKMTPIQYLDDRALTHLRLIMDRFDDSVHDATADMESGWNILAAKRADWGLGSARGATSSSMMVLGIGTLLLIAVGAGIMMLVASVARSTEGSTSTRSIEADSMTSRRETAIPDRRMAG